MVSATTLREMIAKRNNLFATWLKTHHHRDRQRYVAQRRLVVQEVKRAKNTWFHVEKGMHKGVAGRAVWQGIKAIQRGKAGLQPMRAKAIRKDDGTLCMGLEESLLWFCLIIT